MKRILAPLLALLLCLNLLAGCSVGLTTITEQPGNYQYQLNEPIEVIDIETRETLGTLVITGAEILREGPFEAQESDGEGEDGEAIYKTVTYSQIVQIFYTYSGSRKLSNAHFSVRDSADEIGRKPEALEPVPEYEAMEKKGQYSFTVALQNPGGYLDIRFTYNALQIRPTARISVAL